MMARWQQRLEAYNFEVQHVAGKNNGAADGLSRAPHLVYKEGDKTDPFDEKEDYQTLNSIAATHREE